MGLAPSCFVFRFVASRILFLAAGVHDKHLFSVLFGARYNASGTTCTGLHTPIRMPVLCVVFRLETGGEHPFAVPYPFGPDLFPLLD